MPSVDRLLAAYWAPENKSNMPSLASSNEGSARRATWAGRRRASNCWMAAAVVNLTLLAGIHPMSAALLLGWGAALLLLGAVSDLCSPIRPLNPGPSPAVQPVPRGLWVPGSRPDL